jgi:predicted nucleic acid-binding protein
MKIVLDAWALLALIFKEEPAASAVRELFTDEVGSRVSVYISWINLGEVYYTIARRKGLEAAEIVLHDIQMLPVRLQVPSKADILAAATVKSRYNVSYADAFAVSLAQKINGTILTGDLEIIMLKDVVTIEPLSRQCVLFNFHVPLGP